MGHLARILLIALVLAAAPAAQQFEVASIKPAAPQGGPVKFAFLPGGHMVLVDQTLNNMIRQAFRGYTIVGVPEWGRMTRYDIDAKAPMGADTTQPAVLGMLRALLESRFGLKWHVEQREMPVFDLVRDKPDRLGPGLRPSQDACDNAPDLFIDKSLAADAYARLFNCMIGATRTSALVAMRMKGRTMEQLAFELPRLGVDRPVRNRTELAGRFDIDISYTPEAADLAANSGLFVTGLRDSLGLRLEPAQGVIEVAVIDHVERASDN
jgi:uncharacterized protein (TIGR03435 family)